jgi:hypothetical protein
MAATPWRVTEAVREETAAAAIYVVLSHREKKGRGPRATIRRIVGIPGVSVGCTRSHNPLRGMIVSAAFSSFFNDYRVTFAFPAFDPTMAAPAREPA